MATSQDDQAAFAPYHAPLGPGVHGDRRRVFDDAFSVGGSGGDGQCRFLCEPAGVFNGTVRLRFIKLADWLVVIPGGSCDDRPGVEFADDQVDHGDEVTVGAVPAGAALGGLDE